MTLFATAQRTQAKLRLAIDGPSGSGKTYSALLIAKGLAGGDLSKVALLDTERGSGSLYSDLGPYATLNFGPPYTVARFVKAHDAAVLEGYEVIVIDSLTHFWSGEGGILDAVDKIAATSTSGNSFAAWKKGTPLQKQFMDTQLASPCHIIATVRSKTEWVVEENEKGKKVPRKVGLAPEQRKDLEYEYTLVLDLSREHIATASKDRTGLFDDRLEIPSEKMGEELAAWLGSAAATLSPEPASEQRAAQQDEQREQREQAAPADAGNGTITKTQWERLRAVIHAKGRTEKSVLEMALGKGIGNGTPSGFPAAYFENLLATLSGLPDPPPEPSAPQVAPAPPPALSADDFAEAAPASQEPAPEVAASAAASTASAPASAPQEPPAPENAGQDDDDGFGEFDAQLNAAAAEKAAAPEKAKRKATVTASQLTRLGAQCAELEALGLGTDEWRLYMFEKEGVASRTELTKAAATRTIDYLQRWLTDIKSGVIGANEKAVA